MAIPTFDEALAELRNPASTSSQIAALRHLKDEVVGHAQRKELLVQHGLVDALSQTLASMSKSKGKRRTLESNGSVEGADPHSPWAEEDGVRLQCLQLVGSLVQGGPSFLAPLAAAPVVPLLTENLSLSDNAPKIVHASLRALAAFVDAMRHCIQPTDPVDAASVFSDAFYSESTISSLVEILARTVHSKQSDDMVAWICKIIQRSCTTDTQRLFLVEGGVLDALAARLSAYHMQEDTEWPRFPHAATHLRVPCPSETLLIDIIGAVTVIVGYSKYCVARLLYSPVTYSAFPFIKPDPPLQSSFDLSPYSPQTFSNPGDFMLPRIPAAHHKVDHQSRAFPALGSVQPKTPLQEFDTMYNAFSSEHANTPGLESLLVPWLIYTLRKHKGLLRAKSAELLTAIARAGFVSKIRDRMLAVIVAPPLVDGLTLPKSNPDAPPRTQEQVLEMEEVAEYANALAKLLKDSPPLQRATEEAKAIERVAAILKRTFEPVEYAPPMWTPDLDSETAPPDLPPTRRLGLDGLDEYTRTVFHLREAALNLAETLNEKEDKHRKAMTESNTIMTCIIDSLTPFNYDEWVNNRKSISKREKISPAIFGNTDDILKAACRATMSLARSIAVLRTSLIDSKISKPIFKLLSYPRVDVIIEVLNAVINLLPDWSPMRSVSSPNISPGSHPRVVRKFIGMAFAILTNCKDLVDDGVIKALCERAHSADSRIRLLSLWALKHLIYAAPNNIKVMCFEELGTGWLVQVINGDNITTSSAQLGSKSSTSLGAPNAAGERVDLLNAVEEPMDTEEIGASQSGASIPTPPPSPQDIPDSVLRLLSPPVELTQIRANYTDRLKEVKDLEEANALKEAQLMELRIQCKAVDFIRNFTQGHKASDMIEYLYNSLDAKRVFSLLHSKIKPATTTPSAASSSFATTSLSTLATSSIPGTTPQYPQPPELLSSAVFILVHLAAGGPQHRASLMSEPNLLRAVLPLLSHPENAVRLPCVWMLNNLTWVEDQSDAAAARARAQELRNWGFEARLKQGLDDDNESLDVKERINTALKQMAELLGSEAPTASATGNGTADGAADAGAGGASGSRYHGRTGLVR